MIRKVYLDFAREKFAAGKFGWLLSRGMQYCLTHASYIAGRPLCGPILGTVVTNYNCNYRCIMCDLPQRDRELRGQGLGELDTAGMKDVLAQLAALGTSGIGFTGGEPLLRDDIFELLAHARNLGMISHLNTNGSLLNDKNARKIVTAQVDSINVSLDGASASTHDSIRGVQGAFDRAVTGIERLVAARDSSPLRVKTVAVLQEANVGEVRDIVRLAKELSVDCVEFIPRQPFCVDGKTPVPQDPAFFEQLDGVTEYLLEIGSNGIRIENSRAHLKMFSRSFSGVASPLRCYAGYNSYAVDCYGEIYPCLPWCNWRMSVGNLRKTGLAEFWRSPEYNRRRDEIASCRKCYLNCQAELNLLFNPFGR